MFVIFFLLWLVFNGRVTLELLVFGLLVSGTAWYFAYRVVGYSLETDRKIVENLPWALRYLGNLVLEVGKAAAAVIRVALHPSLAPEPVFVEFHSGLESETRNVILASSITLTPGTITVFQEGDFFVVHCLRPEYGEGLEQSSFVRLLEQVK